MFNRDDYETDLEAVAAGLFAVARAIDRLGNADAGTPMGGLEAHGVAIRESADRVAGAVDSITMAIDNYPSPT